MRAVVLLAAGAGGAGAAGCAGIWRPPTRRLAGRVRPYAVVARAALGHPPEPAHVAGASFATTTTLPRLFGPLVRGALARLSAIIETRGDEHLARLLRQAGVDDMTPDEYRVRQLGGAALVGALGSGAAAVLLRNPLVALVALVAGFAFGATRQRRRVERAIAARAGRMRLELYTVNHLLAMHARTGAGVMQAVQRIANRGRGAVVSELRDALSWTRSGMSEADAFRRLAALTPEPSAARTYQLLAAGVERGVDLGAGLLALSEDLRDARREQLHKEAVRRRAAMLVPTIAILAPIMLLFIAAPLPAIVLGHR
jgi:Flp pilus assembly protein TadB